MNRLTHGPGCVKAPTIWANEIIDKDPEDNVILLSELIQAIELHLHIDNPMDEADYVTMDDDISVADNDIDGYEVRLLAVL